MAKAFLGKSLKFPIVGKFIPQSGLDLIFQDIELLLLTNFGERVMRPDFGCNLGSRIWDNLDDVMSNGPRDIVKAINKFEPRVSLIGVTPTQNRSLGLIFFNIQLLIKETNTVANLVFPFKPITEMSQR
jgi:phage baseplate assembly protein W